MTGPALDRALLAFDANAFSERHGGYKESRSSRSHEYLLRCVCGSDRLRWRHEPGVKQAWVCWGGCGRSGDTLDLVMLLEQLTRIDAMEYVVSGYHGGDAPTSLVANCVIPQASRTHLTRLPVISPPRGVEALTWGRPDHARGWQYLLEARGLTFEDVATFRIGYGTRGWLRGYAVFPVFMDGGLVYWQARACWDPPRHLNRDQRKAWAKATNFRKTLNPTSSKRDTGAGDVLLNYDQAKASPHVVIVEGPIDAVKVGRHAVALLGKSHTDTKVERLLRMPAQRYTIYLDPGVEERKKAEQLAIQLNEWAPAHIATPPDGLDPGQLTHEQNAAVIDRAPAFKMRGLVSSLKIR